MPANFIILDTSVLSEARREHPSEDVIAFLLQIPPGALAVPPPVIFELERGAVNVQNSDPDRGRRFSAWLDGLLETDIYIPPVDAVVKRLLARMSMVPALAAFWRTPPTSSRLRFGCDPEIAAVAIVNGFPIASCDAGDFLHIHRHFPLPGLYNPIDGIWHVRPKEGWHIPERRANTADTWRQMIGHLPRLNHP